MNTKIDIENCIFCGKPLDNSDEHIIPSSLNGRLHSAKIICHSCNTTKFGEQVDPAIKKLFNAILLILGFDNASSVHTEDPEGGKYLLDKKGTIQNVKPELTTSNREGKTFISVEGGSKKNAINLFAKQAAELLKGGYKPLKFDVKEISEQAPPLGFPHKFEITQEIIVELNKIALEYYAYCGFDLEKVKHLTERVNILDDKLNNVIFCNWEGEIREIKSSEISHLIIIRPNKKKDLYCYIELFNIICAYIKLYENCDTEINSVYYQDAITGERFNENILLNLDEEPPINPIANFEVQINSVFDRHRDREFTRISNEIILDIKNTLEQEVSDGKLNKEDFTETYLKQCCEAIAHLTVYDYPYMIEEFKDEENHELNYIHSNMQEQHFEKFCEVNAEWIGIKVTFPDEGVYFFEQFYKRPYLKRNGISLVKVYCLLTNADKNKKKYIPYKEFFEGVIPNTPSNTEN